MAVGTRFHGVYLSNEGAAREDSPFAVIDPVRAGEWREAVVDYGRAAV